jgi:hypothetical protein
VDLENMYVCNARGQPITSFHPTDLAKCYHLEKGTKKLDNELLGGLNTTKDLCHTWYKPDKQFKLRPTGGYPMTTLRRPYQYMVAMLCRLYGEQDASKFSLSYMPLIYYCTDKGSLFNWDDILSTNLIEAITTVVKSQPGTFPSFHMSSYLMDIMCVAHQYPKMGWEWQPIDPTIHIYCKVLWEHKYMTKYQNICEHFLAPLYEFIFCTPLHA